MNREKAIKGKGCAGLKSLFVPELIPAFFCKARKNLFRQCLFQEDVFFFVQQVEGGHGGEYIRFVVGGGGGSGYPAVGQFVSVVGMCFGTGRGFMVAFGIDGKHGEPVVVQHLPEEAVGVQLGDGLTAVGAVGVVEH